ncbi:cysteine desulfurase family protein [uncultured Oscillibacter sp.]|uniref:cysteine desulfurase family protein n=1 Tax=uncultured Oscillibacter sp. TaxID=876091 RepID=UPI0025DD4DD1|nr:cysteine desulfurase family protein [uncultured Oscillibacter sp.]
MIYLDHAATTPVPRAVADAMYAVLTEQFGNPSAQYGLGLEMKKRVAAWRETVAAALGCEPGRLFFTSCGTEGDNWAIQAALWQNRRLGRHIVTTAVEHSAVLESCKWMERQGYEVTYLAPDSQGRISPEQVLAAVRPDTALLSVMLVNNELGTVYPLREIGAGLAARNPQTLLHTDAVQGFLKVPFAARTLGADFVTISAHKIGGPKGIGALYIGPRVRNPRPLLPGGGQEGGLRSGTEATAQIAGFAKAAELRTARLRENLDHMAALRDRAAAQLSAIPDLRLIAPGGAPHILAVSLEGWPSQNIVNDLGSRGICISAGSACHQGKPSHVVAALGLPKRVAGGVIRLSFGPETTEADIDACAQALREHHDTRMAML